MADSENKKYLDNDGLLYVKQKIAGKFVAKETGKELSTNDYTTAEKNKLAGLSNYDDTDVKADISQLQTDVGNKVDKVNGKGLSTNDYTTAEKNKLTGLTATQIDTVKVNGDALTPDANKAVNITVPTKTSDLTNDDNVVKDASYVHTDNNFTTTLKNKLDGIATGANKTTVDSELSSSSTNPVQNKIINSALGDKVDKVSGKGLSTNDYTTTEKNKLSGIATGAEVNVINTIKVNGTAQTVTSKAVDISVPTNNNQLTNGAGYQTASQVESAITGKGYQTASDVESAINEKIGSTYKPKGSIAFANLPALSSGVEGFVYNITDSFTTNANFVEGAGKTYPAGTNVVIVNTSGSTYKYDVLSGFVDLSGYVEDSDLVAITNAEIDAIFDA